MSKFTDNVDNILANTNTPDTDIDSPVYNNSLEYEQIIANLQNENKFLKNQLNSYEVNYKDIPVNATELVDRHNNKLFTLCPLTTAHPKNTPIFTKDGKRIIQKKLFQSPTQSTSPNLSKKRKHSPGKSPRSPNKTKKQSPKK